MEDSKQDSVAQEHGEGGKQNGKTVRGQITQVFVSQGDTSDIYPVQGAHGRLQAEMQSDCILKQSLAEAWRQTGDPCRDPRERPTRAWWCRES